MASRNSNRLYETASRVLQRCANGQHPDTTDIELLRCHALSCQIGLNPAELAGAIIWRTQRASEALDSTAA
jgi:hypothetical protein